MIIFHFSGTPGTGKSFLCELINNLIQNRANIKTFDTDYWLDEWHDKIAPKAKSGSEARDIYEKFINAKITKLEKSKEKWILCGVLNYEFRVRGRLLRMPELSWPNHTKKIFLKVDIDTLYIQTTMRGIDYLCTRRDELKKEILEGKEISFGLGDKEYIKNYYQFDLDYHLKRGYILKTQQQALKMAHNYLLKN